MFVLQAISYAFDPQSYEEQVRKGIDDFGGVYGGIVIL